MNLEVAVPITIGSIPLRNDWGYIAAPVQPPAAMMQMVVPPEMAYAVAPPMPGNPQYPTGSVPPPVMGYGVPPPMPGSPSQFPPGTNLPPSGEMMPQPEKSELSSDYVNAAVPPSVSGLTPSAPVILTPYPDMPPPSYDEAAYVNANLKDDDDNSHVRTGDYKPLYPTFKWNA